jgi:hypothetical protein
MKGFVKSMAPALWRVRRRWSVSTSFVQQGFWPTLRDHQRLLVVLCDHDRVQP